MLRMFSYPRRPKSGQITCYLNRTYHVLTTTPRELLPAIVLRPKYSFDNTFLRSYCFIRGGASVGRALWMVVLLLLGTVTCVSAIPQTDLPETCYNEVNTPVNQAPPVVPGIRFVRPSMATVVLPRQVWEAWRRRPSPRAEGILR